MERSTHATLDEVIEIIRSSKLYGDGRGHKYYNVPVAFDTETTRYEDKHKSGFVYIWMLKVGDDPGVTVYGRDIAEFGDAMDYIATNTGMNDKQRLIVYVHNLGYDIEFIRHLITITDQMSHKAHQPMYIIDARGFEFRDSVTLSGGLPLKKIGEDLKDERHSKYKKKVGDLDYTKIRHPQTPLSDLEMGYCEGDVDVLAAYIAEEIEAYKGNITDVPLTNTGRIRKKARSHIFNDKNPNKTRYTFIMHDCVMDPAEYEMCRRAFMGGYTHANINNSNKVVENVTGYDLNSSYPSVMVYERFPMCAPRKLKHSEITTEGALDIINDKSKLSIWQITFYNLKRRPDAGDSYITTSYRRTVTSDDKNRDNGRVYAAARVTSYFTNIDYTICEKCYTWQGIDFRAGLVWDKIDYLPISLIEVVVQHYRDKTKLKGNDSKKVEYNVLKALLNSLYGMSVTNNIRDEVTLTPAGWVTHKLTDEEITKKVEDENEDKDRFLYYPWGVFITAYARRNLWSAIDYFKNDYVYADTDSIYVKASPDVIQKYMDHYRAVLETKAQLLANRYTSISPDDLKPKTFNGEVKLLGEWDYQGTYTRFKTIGAKRYLMETPDGSIKATVAGISKKALAGYLIRTGDPFGSFKNNVSIPADQTDELTAWYDYGVDAIVEDYTGRKYHVIQPYGAYLGEVPFTLKMDNTYLDLIERLVNEIQILSAD